MQRLLIVGCGDVVRRALPQLMRRWRVLALVREYDAALRDLGVRQIRGDLDQRASLKRLAGIAHAVIHSAPPAATLHHSEHTRDQRTRHLLAALRRARSLPRRLVYLSTSGVYGDCGGAWVTEARPCLPQSARACRRVDAETQLRDFGRRSGCAVALLRAPGIYAANRLPLERLRRQTPALNADEDVHTNHIHADDLARACVAALRRARPNRAYNICDNRPLKMGAWFDLLANHFHLPPPPRLPRHEIERILPPTLLSFMRESRRLDNTRMKRELGLRLAYPDVGAALAAMRRQESGKPDRPAVLPLLTPDSWGGR